MSARPSLAARLARVAEPAPTPQAAPAAKAPVAKATSRRPNIKPDQPTLPVQPKARVGKIMVAGYFSPEMARAVKLLAVERGVTVQALIGEALDLVLRQGGKHPMGER